MKRNYVTRSNIQQDWETPAVARVAASRQTASHQLEQLKLQLIRPLLDKTGDPALCRQIQLAANEALAAAWTRPAPFLVFPCLFQTKMREMQEWLQHQQQIRRVTRKLVEAWDFATDTRVSPAVA